MPGTMMEAQEVIDNLREQLDQVEAQGAQQVHVAGLRAYLKALETDAEVSQEYRKRQHEGMLAHYAAKNEHAIEMLKAVLEAGKSALHVLLIINGGAVVTLLGAMSNLAGKPATATLLAKYLALPLLQFGIGVFFGALGFALRYLSQACYAENNAEKRNLAAWGDGLRYAAICFALAGYVAFCLGVGNAYYGVVWTFST